MFMCSVDEVTRSRPAAAAALLQSCVNAMLVLAFSGCHALCSGKKPTYEIFHSAYHAGSYPTRRA